MGEAKRRREQGLGPRTADEAWHARAARWSSETRGLMGGRRAFAHLTLGTVIISSSQARELDAQRRHAQRRMATR